MPDNYSRNTNFYQLDRKDGLAAMATLAKESQIGMRILMYLAKRADSRNTTTEITYDELGKVFGVSKQNISKGISYLVDNYFIWKIRGNGGLTCYVINPNLLFRSYKPVRNQVPTPKNKGPLRATRPYEGKENLLYERSKELFNMTKHQLQDYDEE